jgi:disulfide bond formation protein DsbB
MVLKVVGYAFTIGAAFWGLMMSAALEVINLQALHSPDWTSTCSVTLIKWPLGLRLDEWFPRHFSPDGICGQDSQWFFLGFSMTQWLILIYLAIIAGLILMLASWTAAMIRRGGAAGAGRPADAPRA